MPATLFWNKRWIEQNLQRALHLAQNPLFQIENHGTLHKPLSVNGRAAYGIPGTESAAELVEEIEGNRRFLREFLDVESNWFRSGTAFYDDVAVDIARELGVSLPGTAVASHLRQAAPGAIVLMHMNQPGQGTADGVREAIPQLREAGFTFAKLGEAPV
ncbi:polysaccharide deacetylase family protein [Corynebacterium striatum]|uniref:polysaccharide deacetylase family protein n=1 Tax=Corynebacterium striatum TaxID=43770 RepID=UPI003B5ABB45